MSVALPDRRRPSVQSTADKIRALARAHGVVYEPGPRDEWANKVTELAGDTVQLDEIELTLLALRRAGVISKPERVQLHAAYLGER
jgi:hypothetical protein